MDYSSTLDNSVLLLLISMRRTPSLLFETMMDPRRHAVVEGTDIKTEEAVTSVGLTQDSDIRVHKKSSSIIRFTIR
jgi:hypothetical protein